MYRFLVIALLIVGVAVAAPRFAPGMFAFTTDRSEASRDVEVTALPAAPTPSSLEVLPAPSGAGSLEPAQTHVSSGRRASIPAAPDGHFYADAIINGRSVPVVVDTGATVVVLTEATAHQLGIFPPRSAFKQRVQTANGEVGAALVRLREVRLDGVRVADVEALVLPGESLALNLLGMSFLGRLAKFEAAAGKLILTQ